MSAVVVAALTACGNVGPKPEMPTSETVVMAALAPSSAAKVLQGPLSVAKAAGFAEIGTLHREKVSATCWSDDKCVLNDVSQCPARVLKPWLEDGLLAAAQRGRASAVLIDSEWSLTLKSSSKLGKCLRTQPGSDRYVQVCTTNSRGLSECHSTLQKTWDCADWQHINGQQCVEQSHATLLTDDHAAVEFLRVVAAADARYRTAAAGGKEQIGYIDASGRFVIAPRFDSAGDFSQGRALVLNLVDGKWPSDACWYHVIDRRGHPVPTQGCPLGRFDSGLVRSAPDSKRPVEVRGYMGLDGKTHLPVSEQYTPSDFSEGLAVVTDKKTSTCGYMDSTGRIVVPVSRFHLCAAFSEGRAAVASSPVVAVKGLFSTPGQVKLPPYGYIDRSGELVLPEVYEKAGAFSDGWAFVMLKGQPGFINVAGEVVLRLPESSTKQELVRDFADAVRKRPFEFHEGLARMSDKPGRVGFIDRTGRFAIAPLFSDAREFRDGLAPAAVTTASGITLWGYIRKDGSWAIEPQFSIASAFHDGLAVAGTWVKER